MSIPLTITFNMPLDMQKTANNLPVASLTMLDALLLTISYAVRLRRSALVCTRCLWALPIAITACFKTI